jgi:TPR repeat protein
MKTIRFAALLCLCVLTPLRALAQETEALRKQFLEVRAKAEQGDVESQLTLANFFSRGRGVQTNLAEAVKWYRAASSQNHPKAFN